MDAVSAVDDPSQIHQLSQQAWDKLHPEDVQTNAQDSATEPTPTTSSSGGGATGGGGGDGFSLPPLDAHLGSQDFGNPKGGNFVTDNADTAKAIVNTAKAMLGRPYVWGGETPAGLDCSGLVQYAYKQAGIQMPRLSNFQMNMGKRVAYKDLRPGDLVGWDNSNHVVGADHIAIYIGNGQIIEAPRPGLNVRVSGLYDYDVGQMWAVRIPGKHVAPSAPKVAAPPPSMSTRAIEHASAQRAAAPKPRKKQTTPRRASVL